MQGFSRNDYDNAKLRLRNLAAKTKQVEKKRHAKTVEKSPTKPIKFAADEEVQALTDLQAKLDEVVMQLVTAGLRKGRENALVEAVRCVQQDSKLFFKTVRAERERREMQTEETVLASEETAKSAIKQSEVHLQGKFDALKRKLELTTRGAKQQRAQQEKRHEEELCAQREKHAQQAYSREEALRKDLEGKHAREMAKLENMWQSRLRDMRSEVTRDCQAKLECMGQEKAQLQSKLSKCLVCAEKKSEQILGLQIEVEAGRRKQDEISMKTEHRMQVIEMQLQQAVAKTRELKIERTQAAGDIGRLKQEMREMEEATKVEHARKIEQLKQRKQEQLDDVCARVKNAISQKQAEVAKLQQQLKDAEERAEQSEQLLQQLDQGFIGSYEPARLSSMN